MASRENESKEQEGNAEAPDLEKRRERRNPSPGDAAAGSAITGIPSLTTHKKRGQQIEKDRQK